jgi:hypothetical protein
MNVNIATAANTMGVVTTISIDPTKVSPRIRNKIIRYLQQGTLEGGYRSDARKLGELMIQAFNLDVSSNTWNGIRVVNASSELQRKLIELRKADWSAYIMENPARGKMNGWDYRRMAEDLDKLQNGANGGLFTLYFEDKQYRKLAIAAVAQHLTPEFKANVQKAIDALNGTALIPVRGDFS